MSCMQCCSGVEVQRVRDYRRERSTGLIREMIECMEEPLSSEWSSHSTSFFSSSESDSLRKESQNGWFKFKHVKERRKEKEKDKDRKCVQG